MSEANSVSDLKARAVEALRSAGWSGLATRLERGKKTPREALSEMRVFWYYSAPFASDAAAIAALEALVVSEQAASTAAAQAARAPCSFEHTAAIACQACALPQASDLAHATAALDEARAKCDELRESNERLRAQLLQLGLPAREALGAGDLELLEEAAERVTDERDRAQAEVAHLRADIATERSQRSALESSLSALARSHKDLIVHVRTTAASPPGEFARDAVSRVVSERDAARALHGEALAIQSQIWDTIDGQREGESLVDAVRRVVEERDELREERRVAKADDAAAMERLRRLAEPRSLPKPDRVVMRQRWACDDIDGDLYVGSHPVWGVPTVSKSDEVGLSHTMENKPSEMWVSARLMLTSPRWRYLGNGERPTEASEGCDYCGDANCYEVPAKEASGEPTYAQSKPGRTYGGRPNVRTIAKEASVSKRDDAGQLRSWFDARAQWVSRARSDERMTRDDIANALQIEDEGDRGGLSREDAETLRASKFWTEVEPGVWERWGHPGTRWRVDCAADLVGLRAAARQHRDGRGSASADAGYGADFVTDAERQRLIDEARETGRAEAKAEIERLRGELDAATKALGWREEDIDEIVAVLGRSENETYAEAAQRVVAERDAAYRRGQVAMLSRIRRLVTQRIDAYEASGGRLAAAPLLSLGEQLASLHIANAPTASASEGPGEAGPGYGGTETAGATESVAREGDDARRGPRLGDVVLLADTDDANDFAPAIIRNVRDDGKYDLWGALPMCPFVYGVPRSRIRLRD